MAPTSRQVTITALVGLITFTSYLVLHLFVSNQNPMFAFSKPAVVPAKYKGYTSLYSFDLDQAVFPTWMGAIPDGANISSLSIPGTHDTMTHLVTHEVFQCQNWDLSTQLHAGLRYFDIRARLMANETEPMLGIYHASMPTGYSLADVLVVFFEFLDAHPTEGIIMRIKEEDVPVGKKPPGFNRTFEGAFNHYRLKNKRTAAGCVKHILLPSSSSAQNVPTLPTMGQMRSKILVLQEFKGSQDSGLPYGIPWRSPHIALEDLWIIPTLGHLEDKWQAIHTNLIAASGAADDSDMLYLSHLSASVGVLPIEAAAGPLTNTSIVGMNDRTGKFLVDGQGLSGKTGVVMADFPGRRLVEAILRRNQWLSGTGRI